MKTKILSIVFVLIFSTTLFSATRIKELVDIRGLQDQQLIGYSLVVGLDKTGDTQNSEITRQSMRNMMRRFGINLSDRNLRLRNTAAVMVTAKASPFMKPGNKIDVIVSAMGDARSLEGGTLLMTPLIGPDNQVYAMAQGPVSVGGIQVESGIGDRFRKNYTLTGRVPNGANIEKEMEFSFGQSDELELLLREPDFTSALRISQAINSSLGVNTSFAVDPGRIIVKLADPRMIVATVAQIEALDVTADQEARVVVNERTGTVVVGQNVRLSPVHISHGNLTIYIQEQPIISQPSPFSQGTTTTAPQTQIQVYEEEGSSLVPLQAESNVEELAQMLNDLHVAPRDIISIFQALKEAGALHAELVII